MNKLLIICGPTATGKTSLGIKLAKKFNGEVVCADSKQVYKGMDVGTGKDLPVNSKLQTPNSKLQPRTEEFEIGYHLIGKIPTWLLDIVEPDYRFSVADYVECADLVMRDVLRRKKLPILVGGTGFYIKAEVDGIETIGFPPDWELREKSSNHQIIKLSNLLKKIDPEKWERMNESDRKNPRRLIRAIEIAQSYVLKTINNKPLAINHLFVGLKAPNEILYQRIDERVDKRVKEGIIEEIGNLLDKGHSWENSVLGETIGYKEFKLYLKGETSLSEAIQRWKYDEHSYARRQMTWFKKDKRIEWFDITEKGLEKKVGKRIKVWLTD